MFQILLESRVIRALTLTAAISCLMVRGLHAEIRIMLYTIRWLYQRALCDRYRIKNTYFIIFQLLFQPLTIGGSFRCTRLSDDSTLAKLWQR